MKSIPTFVLEQQALASGYQFVAGVDEVGRGCLAGPVVAAAVILPQNHGIQGLNDSKVLSKKAREALYSEIYKQASGIGIGSVSPDVIDDINILQASRRAMRKAIGALDPQPGFVLVDGNLSPLSDIPQASIVQGDRKCQSIAAASIIAKVFRDSIMANYNDDYPEYDLSANKGYPTAKHLDALKKHGVTIIHRKSFRGVRELVEYVR